MIVGDDDVEQRAIKPHAIHVKHGHCRGGAVELIISRGGGELKPVKP
jgi:hypothetical protein